jgi:dolichyl-phosphate-mannose--protein O-mannosyl transferase
MFFNGHGFAHLWDLNNSAYKFHSSLGSPHPYESSFWSWPIDFRPVYFYLGTGRAKIYNLGNPIIFWMAIPALFFTLWQGVRLIRIRVEEGARVRFFGKITREQLVPLFVIVTYLATRTRGRGTS